MASGGANGGPQYNPANISATGGAGQNPRKPELKYRGMGYGTTGEVNRQATAAPIKQAPVPGGNARAPMMPSAPQGVVPLTAETQFPDEPILQGTSEFKPEALQLPSETDSPDYKAISQYLPAMEWWASLPDTPQTTKDYVRYLRTII